MHESDQIGAMPNNAPLTLLDYCPVEGTAVVSYKVSCMGTSSARLCQAPPNPVGMLFQRFIFALPGEFALVAALKIRRPALQA